MVIGNIKEIIYVCSKCLNLNECVSEKCQTLFKFLTSEVLYFFIKHSHNLGRINTW